MPALDSGGAGFTTRLAAAGEWETAAERLTDKVPIARGDQRVGDVRRELAGKHYDSAAAVVVCDGRRLAGLIAIETLLAADGDRRVDEIMDADPPTVAPGVDQEVAAWKALAHGESSLAVVDPTGAFRGLIPPEQLLRVLLAEHDEDIARLGGFLRESAQARQAGGEPVIRRLTHRLPWLLVGLAGAILSAHLVGQFEQQLQANVMLAFFLPGVVYLADAVGTQTETLIVRGMSVGVSLRDVFRREVLTGLLIGAGLAAAFWLYGGYWFGGGAVVAAVALALLAACSIATAVAMLLPWMLHRLGIDPAFGSGPLATVIQDLLSIVIYLLIAGQLVG